MIGVMIAHCFKQVQEIKEFKIETFSAQVLEMLNPISQMLVPTYSKKFWKAICDKFCVTYVIMQFALSTQYKKSESTEFAAQVQSDTEFISEVFTAKIAAKDLTENKELLRSFQLCLTDQIENVVVHLVKLSKRLKDDFNENCIVVAYLY